MADAHGSGPCGSNTVWVQVPSPAGKKLRCMHLSFFIKSNFLHTSESFSAGESLEAHSFKVSSAYMPRRSVRRENHPLDNFLFPPHPISCIFYWPL